VISTQHELNRYSQQHMHPRTSPSRDSFEHLIDCYAYRTERNTIH